MELKYISLAIKILAVLVPLVFIYFIRRVAIATRMEQLAGKTKESLTSKMKTSKIDFFNFNRIKLYLSKNGIDYVSKSRVDPFSYIGIKMVISLLGFIVGVGLSGTLAGIGCLVVAFILPDLIVKKSNDKDNEAMMDDIRTMYDTLKIQTKAGVFLDYALSECYLGVKNKRLKVALLELNSKIITRNDIGAAIDQFNLQFSNKYLDTFCVIIKQSLQSGQSVQVLEDMSNQMVDINRAKALKEKQSLDRNLQIYQLLLMIGIIVTCVFVLLSEVDMSLMNF